MKVFYKQVQLNPTTATDYTDLLNKPSINGVELDGDKDTEQIKVTWFGTQDEFDALGTYSPSTFYIIDDGVPMGQQEDYLDLANKPMINGQVLTGNKQSSDLNIYNMDEVDNMLASLRSIRVVSALPTAPLANTMYYVGPDSEGIYLVYLFDSMLNRIDLGESVQRLYEPGDAIRIDEGNNKIHVKYDDKTLEINSEGKLSVIAADNTTAYMNGHLLDSESNSVNTDILWHGTQAEFDLITTKNPNTVYFIEDAPPYLNALYPVGSIYMSATLSTAAQVNSALGGTWQAWGAGRVPVGVDTTQTEFNTVQKTGGEKTVTLATNQMPDHRHTTGVATGGSVAAGNANDRPARMSAASTLTVDWNIAQTSYVNGSNSAATTQAHNNLPPYITCYMYLRIA